MQQDVLRLLRLLLLPFCMSVVDALKTEYRVICLLLAFVEGLDVLGTRRQACIQASYLFVIQLQHSSVRQRLDYGTCGVCDIHQLLARDVSHLPSRLPAAEVQVFREYAELSRRACQDVESSHQRCLAVIVVADGDIGLTAGTVCLLFLHAMRQCSHEDVSERRHIVVGHPLPQTVL